MVYGSLWLCPGLAFVVRSLQKAKRKDGSPEATGDREQGRGHAIGRVFIPALEGICNLRVQDF